MTTPSPLFPVGLQAHWLTQLPTELSFTLRNWLLDPTSLTARLKSHSQQFQVQLLGQHIEACSQLEACSAIPLGSDVLVREVLLYCDHKPHIFARSILPISSLNGQQSQLADLGEQPLGQVLFSDPNLQRKTIEVASFNHCSVIAQLCKKLDVTCREDLWGRRSLFYIDGKPLMVAEVFLPDAIAYQENRT